MFITKKLSCDTHKCSEDYSEILANSAMVDVTHVKSYLCRHYLFHISLVGVGSLAKDAVLIDILYRSPICYARPYIKHAALLWRVKAGIFLYLWTRPNQAHVACEHVPQLRQLIKLIPAYESACSCYAVIMFANRDKTFLVRTNAHGTKLIKAERFAATTYALL